MTDGCQIWLLLPLIGATFTESAVPLMVLTYILTTEDIT